MRCPKCNSENVKAIETFPTLDYAEKGEYITKYHCSDCNFDFQNTSIAEEPIFGEEV